MTIITRLVRQILRTGSALPSNFIPRPLRGCGMYACAIAAIFAVSAWHASAACSIDGTNIVCTAATNSFTAISGASTNAAYAWDFTSNSASASISGASDQPGVQVVAAAPGVFTLQCTVIDGATTNICSTDVTVSGPTDSSPLSDQAVCPQAGAMFTTTPVGPGPFTFVWRKDGNPITNAVAGTLVLTNVGAADTGSYCVDISGPCSTLTRCATLSFVPPPVIQCPPPLTLNCVSDVPAPDTNSLVVTGAVYVEFVSDVASTNTCGLVISRGYEAVNSCSITSICTQTIVVANTNPPAITCASNRVVECGSVWGFDIPSAVDFCGSSNVLISISGTVTNPLVGSTFSATRSWLATDACSNTAFCSQTITVVDTTPPLITCSSNLVLECAGSAGTPGNFTTTATDACDTNVTVVCAPPSGTLFPLGTNVVVCTATDASGNTNLCSFTVTVQDTTPPLISCPTNMNVAEAPRDSGSATVTLPAPTTSDICDNSLIVTSSPPSGSTFALGTTVVTNFAYDHSGNSNSCQFSVRVIPYRLYVTNTDDSGPGTLRQALLDANDSPDDNLVLFNLPGPAPYSIQLQSALPVITSPVIVDGWSQSGTNLPPVIEVRGDGITNGADGLVVVCGHSTIRGLALRGFVTAIRLATNGANVVQGNYIGTDVSGTNAAANSGHGIVIGSSGNLIGGTAAGCGNVVSANGGVGLRLDGFMAQNNVLQGNFIGVAADGTTPLGNAQDGIFLTNQASATLIGGVTNGSANTIANNGRNGVTLASSAGTRNAILGNPIFGNVLLGIDLGDDGVTPNDPDDSDTGPNQLQNFPLLTDAQSADGTTTIYGQLTTVANRNYRVEFFLNDAADPSGYGQAHMFIGATTVTVHGSGTATFVVPFPLTATYTQFITATATDTSGNTSEFSADVQVRTPPVLGTQPTSTNVAVGGSATFCATATGTPPIFYQWRLNGVNIPGATNQCYTIPDSEIGQAGTYSVIVGNNLGALATQPATLTLPLTNVPGADNFADRVLISGLAGTVSGQNVSATFEAGEPMHAGKPGGKSVWYKWVAPVTGVMTLDTIGSTFDTLLAVYSAIASSNLVFSNLVVDASDVGGGGFYTSKVRFNVTKDQEYEIAIDGFGGDSGYYVLSWSEEDTPKLLPFFRIQPMADTVAPGDDAVFTSLAVRVCGFGHQDCPDPTHYPNGIIPGLSYQWFFMSTPIPGATSTSLTVSNVQTSALGNYHVEVSTLWQTAVSDSANLQINLTGEVIEPVQATDQFLDSADAPNILIIGDSSGGPAGPLARGVPQAAPLVRGFTGTQIFNTAGSATGPGEVICGVIGGASEWITFVADAPGTLFLNTDGSSYNTVMAVYQRSPNNPAVLQLLACDKNSGSNGLTSALSLPVQMGTTNFVVVDGVGGVSGILQLNYALATSTLIQCLGANSQGAQHLQVLGRPNLHFTIQATTNFSDWISLVTTTSQTATFDYFDFGAINSPKRYYRALLLP